MGRVEPMIEWSFNPRHDSAAYLMSRNDVLSGARTEEIPFLKAIIGDGSFPCNAASRDRIAEERKLSGEENTVNWYTKEELFLNPQELRETLATKPTRKIQEHRPGTDRNTTISKQEVGGNAEDNQMPSWFQKIAANYKLPRSKGPSVTTKTLETQQIETSSDQQKGMEENPQSLIVHQKDKKKKNKKNKDKSAVGKDDDGDDLLSSLLGTKKKKKKKE